MAVLLAARQAFPVSDGLQLQVTPMLGVLDALCNRNAHVTPPFASEAVSTPRMVVFVWACRSAAEFQLMNEWLQAESRWEHADLSAAKAQHCSFVKALIQGLGADAARCYAHGSALVQVLTITRSYVQNEQGTLFLLMNCYLSSTQSDVLYFGLSTV